MQAAELADEFMAGTQIEMIGVGEDDARAKRFERVLGEGFYGSSGADRHEYRRFDCAMGRKEQAASRAGWIGLQDFKRKIHRSSVSGENKGPDDLDHDQNTPNGEGNDIGFGAL